MTLFSSASKMFLLFKRYQILKLPQVHWVFNWLLLKKRNCFEKQAETVYHQCNKWNGSPRTHGAHHWARTFQSFGHEVRLIAPQFVKPFVKSNKNDAADAEAIAEAAQRPNMRYVSIKTPDQQDQQTVHRIRNQTVKSRTVLINQIRGMLLEHGIQIPVGRSDVRPKLCVLCEDAEDTLRSRFRYLLSDLFDELVFLDDRIDRYDGEIKNMVSESENAKRLMTIPGVGPQTATAVLCSIGDINGFKNGRELAAFLGLVPRQHSTGGKPTLLGISKRGDIYLRTLFIHGARAVIRNAQKN